MSAYEIQSMLKALPTKADMNSWASEIKEALKVQVDTIKQQVAGISSTMNMYLVPQYNL